MHPAPGLVVNRKYRLVRPLGEGGMGMVWVARHEQLDIDVAVKLMSPALSSAPSLVGRFEREAKAAAQLKSPNVVHILDYGVEAGSPYIVMDLLIGEDLAALLDRETRTSPSFAVDVVSQTAKALRVAHDAGIVHRDLKPPNIFLERPGGDLLVKILDFGIAKEMRGEIEGRNRTTTGLVLGSPLYMSPEQARGGAVGPSSDLWSLAVVAFEMITGVQPFHGESVGDVIAKICGDRLPVPSHALPGLPPEIDAFFERALERDPARRFGSAREFADAFAAAVSASPAQISAPAMPRERGVLASAPTLAAGVEDVNASADDSRSGAPVVEASAREEPRSKDEPGAPPPEPTAADVHTSRLHATDAGTPPTSRTLPTAASSSSWRRVALALVIAGAAAGAVYTQRSGRTPPAAGSDNADSGSAAPATSPSQSSAPNPSPASSPEPRAAAEASGAPVGGGPSAKPSAAASAAASAPASTAASASAARPATNAPRPPSTATATSPNPFF